MSTQVLKLANLNPVLTLDISPDGKQFVVGQQGDYFGNPNLTLWQVETMQLLAEIEKVKFINIESARFVCDGKTLIYIKNSEGASLYDLTTMKHLDTSLNTANAIWLSPARNAHRLVVSGIVTEIWDVNHFKRVWTMPEYIALVALNLKPAIADITPDGTSLVVTGNKTEQTLIFDINQGKVVKRLNNGPSQTRWAKLSNDLSYFAVIGARSKGIFVWDFKAGERCLQSVFNSKVDGYWSLCFHPSNKYLAVGSLVGYISIYDLSNGEIIASQKAHEGRVWDLTFTPDGRKLFSGGDDGIVHIWEPSKLDE